MSDPVTNTEIEDVLTSIRRLVSENRPLPDAGKDEEPARPLAFDTSSAQDEVAQSEPVLAEAPLALVLTPALRVEDAPEADGDERTDDLQEGFDEADTPDVSEADLVDETEVADEQDETVVVEAVDAEQDQDSYETEEDTPDVSEAVQDDVMVETASENELTAPEDEVVMPMDEVRDVAPEEAVDEEQPFDFKQVLEARIHQFRDATSTEDLSCEPQVGASPDVADAVMDDLRAHMPEEIADSAEIVDVEALSEAMDETAEIDEAMLREMVADIVRQELQGALGERITRNVRKLVRREIHRALAAHDLG
jgi:hypothetical protein